MTHLLLMVDTSMAAPAKRSQVVERVVSRLSGRGDAVSVDMVNVEVFRRSATLAGVLVALQSRSPIAIKFVVVSGLVGVLLESIRVRGKPFVNALHFCGSLATRALVLRAGSVLKVVSALGAHQDRSDRGNASRLAQLAEVFDIFKSSVFRFARRANFLPGTGWCVFGIATQANSRAVWHVSLHSRKIPIVAQDAKA
jgi:hypothetical protein